MMADAIGRRETQSLAQHREIDAIALGPCENVFGFAGVH